MMTAGTIRTSIPAPPVVASVGRHFIVLDYSRGKISSSFVWLFLKFCTYVRINDFLQCYFKANNYI